tara:strand:- start:9518 stop:9808 length:291 start_codon:yes stop_codon:yes gene_type:complete
MTIEELLLSSPSVSSALLVLMASALAAGSVTQVFKASPIYKKFPAPWLLRFVSSLSGGIFGLIIAGPAWGLTLGIGAGAICTATVALVKKRIRDAA